jgi:hypothetical protein
MEMKSLEHPDAERQRRQEGRNRHVSDRVRRILRNRRTLLVVLWLGLKFWRLIKEIFDGS